VANAFDASACVIHDTTQNIVILSDDEFGEVVQADLQVIKQAWAVMEKGDKPFILVISKSQKKKIKQLARSVGHRGEAHNGLDRAREESSHARE
jgi:hypothetical protein